MTKLERSRLRIGGMIAIGVALVAVVLPLFLDFGRMESPRANALGQPQGMELRGKWLGMSLAAANSPTAWQLGVPQGLDGIAVVDVSQGPDVRAIQAGLAPGDVIQAVNDQGVDSLSELFTVTTRLDGNQPVQLRIRRQGMPLNLTVPPVGFAGAPMAGQAPPGLGTPAAAAYYGPGTGPGMAAGPGWNAGVGVAYGPGTGMHRNQPGAGYPAPGAVPGYACPNTFAQ